MATIEIDRPARRVPVYGCNSSANQSKACSGHGVGGVPGFLINGRLMTGAQPLPTFKKVIEEELNGGFEATQKKAAADGKKAG